MPGRGRELENTTNDNESKVAGLHSMTVAFISINTGK